MRLFLHCLAVSSLAIMGALGNIVEMAASIEIPGGDIENLVEPNEKFWGFKILNEIDGEIYIGGREILIIYNPATNTSRSYTFKAWIDPNEIVTCEQLVAADNREKVCQHYIRLAEQLSNDYLLVCGTNRQNPRGHLVDVTTGEVVSNFSAERKSQRSVYQNTTARFSRGQLYVGFSEGTQANPSHISKFTINMETLNETSLDQVAETDDQNENFVNEPQFVGKPYVKNGFMYFFYRETAVEAVNQGKFVYSRVARICLSDNGTNGNFEIFVKARLNCSLQGDYPFYFNHIQDVIFEEEDDDTIFYAVFTTTPHGPSSSAVCTYILSDIDRVFENSKFKGKESPGKLPGPVNRPPFADKITNCERLNAEERKFLQRYPLMDDLVPNYNAKNLDSRDSDKPLFYSTSMNLYSIAVHSTEDGNIFYVGTEHGTIIKAYYSDMTNGYVFYEQEIWDAKSAVTGLRVDKGTKTLLFVTGEGLFRMNLEGCSADCRSECEDFHFPYCTYGDSGPCRAKSSTPESTDNQNAVNNRVRILSMPPGGVIHSCNSRKVELTGEVKSSTLCGAANLVWMLEDETLVNCTGERCVGETSSVGHLITFREIVMTKYHKLVHLSVDVHKGKTDGDYICMFDQKDSKKSVKIMVDDSKGCLTKKLWEKREEHRMDLMMEKTSLATCSIDQSVSSENVLFKKCNECPGNPDINQNA